MPSVSVAMCTYNGAKYVQEQLDSFIRQTRRPDELIICDDASTDGTVDIANSFARTAPFDVRVVVRQQNIGTIKNFEDAISRCSGDIIFLSDQDDVWHADKIELSTRALSYAPNVGGVVCDGEVVTADLSPMGLSIWDDCRITPELQNRILEGNAFAALLHRVLVPGAALAFRSSLRPLLLPISPEAGHDVWIIVLLAAFSRLTFVDRRLYSYRQHSANAVGVHARLSRSQRRLQKLSRKIRNPREFYRKKLDDMNRDVRWLDDLKTRLASQNEPTRLSQHFASIDRRRKRLSRRRRRLAIWLCLLGGTRAPVSSG